MTAQTCRKCGGPMAPGGWGFLTCPACVAPTAYLTQTDPGECHDCGRPTASRLTPPRCTRCRNRVRDRQRMAAKRTARRGGATSSTPRRSPLHPDPVLCGLATPERIAELAARAAATPPLPLFPNRRSA